MTLNVPYDENLSNDSWKLWPVQGGKAKVVTRCSNGHIGTLDHLVLEDGTVSPSVVCQKLGCNYHEFIKLEGWTYGRKEREAFIQLPVEGV